MLGVKVLIVRYVDDAFPGFVECLLVDASDRAWLFIEKVPVVTSADVDASTQYPQPAVIACEVVAKSEDAGGVTVVTISTEAPWGIAATSGETRFDVRPEQLTE